MLNVTGGLCSNNDNSHCGSFNFLIKKKYIENFQGVLLFFENTLKKLEVKSRTRGRSRPRI